MSLRSRLLLAAVSLVTLGLLATDATTYAILRSSLIGRVDEQLRGSRSLATRAMFEPAAGLGSFGQGRRDGDQLPVIYTALLDPAGAVVAARPFGFGPVGAPPDLPAGLPGSSGWTGPQTTLFTADATDGGLRYRVLATGLRGNAGSIVVAYPLRDVDATLRKLLAVEAIVTLAVLAGVAALALWLVRVGLAPLTQMEAAAADIAAGNLSRRVEPADARTEVGRLGRALNAMLERIEAAFAERRASEERLRRFVADASHELRTPLTSIRGYAELFRRGADARPDDLAKSMRRIEEESARMSELVDELLLLAGLDQGRPLTLEPVDLAALAEDAVSDARAAQPERPIDVDAPRPVVVGADEARLRQVVANLLSNALQHTPLGTPVHVRVAADDIEAVLEVADEGPGLDDTDAQRVFDRFYRADPVRSRASGNTGLGLAIVAAIVHAHGGRVGVDGAPGEGARFTVGLPLWTEPG